MLYFPKTLSLKQSNDFIKKINKHFAEHGFGLYAIELKKN